MTRILVYSDSSVLAAELAGFEPADTSVLTLSHDDADYLANCGAAELLRADIADALPESCARSIAGLVEEQEFDLIIIGATARGRDLAAQLAGYLDCGMGSDVADLRVEGGRTSYRRDSYGGNAISVEHIDGLAVVTVGRSVFEPASAPVAKVRDVVIEPDERVALMSREATQAAGVDMGTADTIIGAGMGVTSTEQMEAIENLAESIGAVVGCSRGIAEEREWLPRERYIGISGNVVKPQLYLALGISGQVQHMYGVRDAKVIAAIDKSENAPICRNADYYIVGDLAEYLPLLSEAVH